MSVIAWTPEQAMAMVEAVLLKIEEELGESAEYLGQRALKGRAPRKAASGT